VEAIRHGLRAALASLRWVQTTVPLVGSESVLLAAAGASAGADKVLCVRPQDGTGGSPVMVQWVDVITAQVEWSREVPADASNGPQDAALQKLSLELVAHVTHQELKTEPMVPAVPPAAAPELPSPPPAAPAEAPLPLSDSPSSSPPAPPVEAPALHSVSAPSPMAPPQTQKTFWTLQRAAGVALLASAALLLPSAMAVLVLAGAGHLGGSQLILTQPGQSPPQYFSPVFTLTWADFLSAAWLCGLACVLGIAGVALLASPFQVI
jgi:hypothetical protein